MQHYDTIKTDSHIGGLKIALLHRKADTLSGKVPVLFIHGSSFPSAMSFGFKMGGYSWMDKLAENGIGSFALDFLGYGNSDRYPEMYRHAPAGIPAGRAADVYRDIGFAMNLALKQTGADKIDLIAHSWGASVAMLYASKYPDKINKLVLYAPIVARKGIDTPQSVNIVYEEMTPEKRVELMNELSPEPFRPSLEAELTTIWKRDWLLSDPLAKINPRAGVVRFPAGPNQDINDLMQGKPYYDASLIRAPVLLVRGEWDQYPSNTDAGELFGQLRNAAFKKHIVLEKGSHVIHLEKSRAQLYREVFHFLSDG